MVAQKIVPNIWCNRNAEEVGAFYAEVFENARYRVESRYPEVGLPEFQQEFAGQVLTIELTLSDYTFRLIHAGDEFAPNPSISFMLNFDPLLFDGDEELARASLERLWHRLLDGGIALMALDEYPFSPKYGWVQDRFGISWQLLLSDPKGDSRPFVLPALLFGGPAQNQAAAAVDHYLEVFADVPGGSALGLRAFYEEPHGPAVAGAVQFSDFRIGDQWFIAMDAAFEQSSSFTSGVSLEVSCRGQQEIDQLWERLSAVPEAEQCGWLVDRFGVSWQIVPENMGDLMQRPGAYQRLLEMKKLVISEF